jgi:DNA-directed RNA polymerase subunit RPC12/RpoP
MKFRCPDCDAWADREAGDSDVMDVYYCHRCQADAVARLASMMRHPSNRGSHAGA